MSSSSQVTAPLKTDRHSTSHRGRPSRCFEPFVRRGFIVSSGLDTRPTQWTQIHSINEQDHQLYTVEPPLHLTQQKLGPKSRSEIVRGPGRMMGGAC